MVPTAKVVGFSYSKPRHKPPLNPAHNFMLNPAEKDTNCTLLHPRFCLVESVFEDFPLVERPASAMTSSSEVSSKGSPLDEPRIVRSSAPSRQRPYETRETTATGVIKTVIVPPCFDADDARRNWQGDRNEGLPLQRDESLNRNSSVGKKKMHTRDLSDYFATANLRDTSPLEMEESQDRVNEMIGFGNQVSTNEENESSKFPVQEARPSSRGPFPERGNWDDTVSRSNDVKKTETSDRWPAQKPSSKLSKKHRRGVSGEVANPAHRRINSVGNTALVDRTSHQDVVYGSSYFNVGRYGGYPQQQPQSFPSDPQRFRHHSQPPAGLDILAGAASKDQLDDEAKDRKPPPNPQFEQQYYLYPPPHSAMDYHRGYFAAHHPPYPPPHGALPYFPVHTHPMPYPRPFGGVAASDSQHPAEEESKPTLSTSSDRILTSEPLFATSVPSAEEKQPSHGGRHSRDPSLVLTQPEKRGHHHRHSSSISSFSWAQGGFMDVEPGHQRMDSSNSFLKGLEGIDPGTIVSSTEGLIHRFSPMGPDAAYFTQKGAVFNPSVVAPASAVLPTEIKTTQPVFRGVSPEKEDSGDSGDSMSKQNLSSTTVLKGRRKRRKCNIAGCPNRVVQGGLCISHGAKRKTCKHPGCSKNVKKAGLCSAHGPARKRCEEPDCGKVAVQGGRCIAHGAQKKLCKEDECTKQAILSGRCKKHHDLAADKEKRSMTMKGQYCVEATGEHKRGLSIFQDISHEAVGEILQNTALEAKDQEHPLRK